MRFSVLGLDGHLGDRVSALVDGQLSAAEEDRAWTHTMGCPGCRRLIERERWMKSRLSAIAAVPGGTGDPAPRAGLIGALYDVDAWAAVDGIERDDRRRRTAFVAVGASSVGAAVLGLVVLTGAPAGVGERAPLRQAPAAVNTGVPSPVGSPSPLGTALRHRAR